MIQAQLSYYKFLQKREEQEILRFASVVRPIYTVQRYPRMIVGSDTYVGTAVENLQSAITVVYDIF
jgi:hypothetical protein